jgi:hypothetical protein
MKYNDRKKRTLSIKITKKNHYVHCSANCFRVGYGMWHGTSERKLVHSKHTGTPICPKAVIGGFGFIYRLMLNA